MSAADYAPEGAETSSTDNIRLSDADPLQYFLDENKDLYHLDQSLGSINKAIETLPDDTTDTEQPFPSFLRGLLLLSKHQYHHPTRKKKNMTCGLQPDPQALEKLEDLDNAAILIKRAQKCLERISPMYPNLAVVYYYIGEALEARYSATLSCTELMEAHEYYEKAVTSSKSPRKKDRTQNHTLVHRCLYHTIAVLLLQNKLQSIPVGYERYALWQICGLPAEAAAVTLSLSKNDDLQEALRLLELTRGVIIGSSITLKSLARKHPDEFQKFQQAFQEVPAQSDDLLQYGLRSENDTQYLALPDVLASIRQLPEFHDFLSPRKQMPDVEQLVEHGGAIVVFNATRTSSDAIIILSKDLKHIPLPSFELEDIEANIVRLRDTVENWNVLTRAAKNSDLRCILKWLWEAAVEPVCSYFHTVNELHKRERPTEAQEKGKRLVERIWWIGVGSLSKLPFHAAGIHSESLGQDEENVIQNFRSAYIPTIKTLESTLKTSAAIMGSRDTGVDLTIIHMQETPGYTSLRGIQDEVDAIAKNASQFGIAVQLLNSPTKAQVLIHLNNLKVLNQGIRAGRQQIIHFSCHGACDARNPLNSHFVLAHAETCPPVPAGLDIEEESKTATNLLSMRDICDLDLNNACLAYLGACRTANNAVIELADESLHLLGIANASSILKNFTNDCLK
ncbi:hypothetical protein CPC08DRAFT_771219 [Agrocybe pediades]|nr:hypothetical protein CPC08DRAFT_771219 [Agrocybe pediades]